MFEGALSRATDERGVLLTSIEVRYKIDPESNPIHVKEFPKLISGAGLENPFEIGVHTHDHDKGENVIWVEKIPEDRIATAMGLLHFRLADLKNKNALAEYSIRVFGDKNK